MSLSILSIINCIVTLRSIASIEKYFPTSATATIYSAISNSTSFISSEDSWETFKPVLNRLQKHVYGHSTYGEIRQPLMRNHLCNESCQQCLSSIVRDCPSCIVSNIRSRNHSVSLRTLNRELNSVVGLDHFHLDCLTLFHEMDSVTGHSAAMVLESAVNSASTYAFEACWLSQFWIPIHCMQGLPSTVVCLPSSRQSLTLLSCYATSQT